MCLQHLGLSTQLKKQLTRSYFSQERQELFSDFKQTFKNYQDFSWQKKTKFQTDIRDLNSLRLLNRYGKQKKEKNQLIPFHIDTVPLFQKAFQETIQSRQCFPCCCFYLYWRCCCCCWCSEVQFFEWSCFRLFDKKVTN